MKKKYSLPLTSAFLFVCFLLIFPANAQPQDSRAVQVVPDEEKRSFIREMDGYAYLSEDMTLAQTRAAAFANAKRQALEAAKTYIQSKTKVKDFQVEYDLVWSSAEGAVTILDQKDYGVKNNVRYHVWIKAEVEYEVKPKRPEAGSATIMDKDAPLTVKVWTDKKHYKAGERARSYSFCQTTFASSISLRAGRFTGSRIRGTALISR